MFPNIPEDYRLTVFVVAIIGFAGLFLLWNWRAKIWLEKNDRLEPESPRDALDWLLGRIPRGDPVTLRYSEEEFQEIVSKVLDEIPQEFDKEWKNVAVIVSTGWPSETDKKRIGVRKGHVLFGSYSGIDRAAGRYSDTTSHVIVIYQPAIELRCGSDKECLEREVRQTVLHELAHHLGMSHEKMREIGL